VGLLKQALTSVGTDIESAASSITINGFYGMVALERGFIFSSMILAAISVFLIERDFLRAAYWSIAGLALAFFGVIHTYQFVGNDVTSKVGAGEGLSYSIGYLAFVVIFIFFHIYGKKAGISEDLEEGME
jgi:hypothetical protein